MIPKIYAHLTDEDRWIEVDTIDYFYEIVEFREKGSPSIQYAAFKHVDKIKIGEDEERKPLNFGPGSRVVPECEKIDTAREKREQNAHPR